MRTYPVLLGLSLAGFLAAGSALAAEKKTEKKTTPASVVAVFRLRGEITESPSEGGFSSLFSMEESRLSFKDLVGRMKKAAKDAKVKAVTLVLDGGSLGAAQREELRQAMHQLRSAGKDLYAVADSLTMGEYVLVSGASRISVVPTADLWITGLNGESPYLRGLLDMIGVKPEFLTCGEYKSAAETFMRTGPSEAAERMQNWLLDSLYETSVRLIAKGRGVDEAKVRGWIDNGPYSAERAKAAGLIDAVESREEFQAMLKSKYGPKAVFEHKYGQKKSPKMDFSSPFAMFKMFGDMLGEGKEEAEKKPAVGIVYVDGEISLGGGTPSPFGEQGATSSKIRKALDEAARDDSIKAVVLRIDSPGGSAVASDIILNATKRVKAKKPFVVSMGNVAGSGGYYVACGSDIIYADDATITGSIGVVSGKLVTTGMWKKIGINFKEYKRGENAGMLSSGTPFNKEERARMQGYMDEIYGVFKKHVEDIRHSRLKKPLDEMAGGRVYTGRQALELGLVDRIGTLDDAIEYIAKEAKVTDYEVRVVPKPRNFLEQILEDAAGGKDERDEVLLRSRLPRTDLPASLVDLAMPYLKQLDPQRVSLVTAALRRLQLINHEGAVLMMPEMRLGR